MNKDKIWQHIYVFTLIIITPAIYKSIGIADFWFFDIPRNISLVILMITTPVGFYIVLKKFSFVLKWLTKTWRENNSRL